MHKIFRSILTANLKAMLGLAMLAMLNSLQAADTPRAPLSLTDQGIHDAVLQKLENGAWEIRTTGTDPYLFTEPLGPAVDLEKQHVLAFEYFSTTGAGQLQVFLVPMTSEALSVQGAVLGVSQGFSQYAVDLKPVLAKANGKVRALRIDFGTKANRGLRLRDLHLRPLNEQEKQLAARRLAEAQKQVQLESALRSYLDRTYPCRITQVSVGEQQIKIEGEIQGGAQGLFLAEAPLYTDLAQATNFSSAGPILVNATGRFSTLVNRFDKQGGQERDRLLSRWAIVRQTGRTYELVSHGHYADSVAAKADLPEEKPRNKKGLGGFSLGRPVSDLDEMNIAAVTVNIPLNSFMRSAPGQGHVPVSYGGHTWYVDTRAVEHFDQSLREAAQRHVIVSAIILLNQGANAPAGSWNRLAAHPDAHPSGIYVMPNVTSAAGLNAYAAALDFLAQRYSRPDNKYGRIHCWILHNEVNAGWVWTNAGHKPALLYMDLYQKSMRIAHLLTRQYNPHAKVFISLEHHWNMRMDDNCYKGRDLLDFLLQFSAVEGDFDWGIAHHPYPQNLFVPRVWEDTQATFSFDTPKITFKNLEVLDAWVKQPRTFYLGQTRRTVHLTEQGLNSPDYTEKSLREQAAGMAYAWNKYKHLESIEVFHYHNWADNRGEGGLRIGLRKFPDEAGDPHGKKPIWFVYQALGTPREEEATAFARTVIGIKNWAEIRHAGKIE